MQPFQDQIDQKSLDSPANSHPKATNSPSFSPFLANKFSVEAGDCGFLFGSVCYSSRHNMIIACPLNDTMQFYDATTFLRIKERETQRLDDSVMQISFDPETDTYIMGSPKGYIYTYNASTNELKKLKRCDSQVMTAIFVNSTCYAYSESGSKEVFLGTLGNENVVSSGPQNNYSFFLQRLSQGNLLLSGSADGSMAIYRTDKLPRLPIFCSFRAHQDRMFMLTAQRIVIGQKEYVVTASQDQTVKIWHLLKGRMRLLRVICCEEIPVSLVYLENYKMLAIALGSESVKFVRLLSGKLESTISWSEDNTRCLFFMKERNMIGVTSYDHSSIELIQLGGVKGG